MRIDHDANDHRDSTIRHGRRGQIGTLAVLLKAKERGIVSNVRDAVDMLITDNIHVSLRPPGRVPLVREESMRV
jgi:predicted nucleic acid-binding protein